MSDKFQFIERIRYTTFAYFYLDSAPFSRSLARKKPLLSTKAREVFSCLIFLCYLGKMNTINRNKVEAFVELDVFIPLIFAGLFMMVDIAMFIRVIYLLKKSKDVSVENLGNKLNPFLYATGIVSLLMAICLMIVTVMK